MQKTPRNSRRRLGGLAFAALLATGFVGCRTEPVALEPLPRVIYPTARTVPDDQTLVTVAVLERETTSRSELHDDVTAPREFAVPAQARVVISVPVVEEESIPPRTAGPGFPGTTSEGGLPATFKTAGYFNKAEQQIEKSLIEKNFTVLDRSKFEAKLRDERDERLAQGVARTQDVDVRRASAGPELVDISELIRAAQSGDVQAEYILQVNDFRTDPLSDRTVDLTELPDVQILCRQHPGLLETLASSPVRTVTLPGFAGLLNAKLIEVQSGAIRWVGEHRVDSPHVLEDGLRIQLRVTKSVSNGEEIEAAYARFDQSVRSLERQVRRARSNANEDELSREERDAHATEYGRLCEQLRRLLAAGPPPEALARWRYEYSVVDVTIQPELPTGDDLERLATAYDSAETPGARHRIEQEARRYDEYLSSHYIALAKLVAKELISTIPSD